jgi:hypothetical protein
MNDDDLIRRGNVAKAMADYHWKRYASRVQGGELSSPAVFTSHTWQDVQDIIASLPAAQPAPEVAALVEALRESAKQHRIIAGMDMMGASAVAYNAARAAEAALAAMEGRG